MGGSVVIAAGCPIPKGDQSKHRGEGGAFILRGHAIDAWENGGELRKSWGYRILRVTSDTGRRTPRWTCYLLLCTYIWS